MTDLRIHTRHIPIEHIRLDIPKGQSVVKNGLCNVLDRENLLRLKDIGVQTVETRLVWWECEPSPGKLDFSRLHRDIDKIESAGLEPAVFPWFQHPPQWFLDSKAATCLRCLEHNTDSTILSIWDPNTIQQYERLYDVLKQDFAEQLKFIYVGISGDYGEYCLPSGVQHYKFSPSHGHVGFWAGDKYARKSFADFLEHKYSSADNCSKEWKIHVDGFQLESIMPSSDFNSESFQQKRDFAEWYTSSLDTFADKVCKTFRNKFPNIQAGIPVGFESENLRIGQIKSHAAKLAAKYNLYCRWTGIGYMNDFASSNVLSRRLASAAHFYKAPFATEAALFVTEENALSCLYESYANGSELIHDDPMNFFRAEKFYKKHLPAIASSIQKPQTDIAIYWPVEDEQLLPPNKAKKFAHENIARLSELRGFFDYDLCDSYMINDGFLESKQHLILPDNPYIPSEIKTKLRQLAKTTLCIWLDEQGPKDFITQARRVDFDLTCQQTPGFYILNLQPQIGAKIFKTDHDTRQPLLRHLLL